MWFSCSIAFLCLKILLFVLELNAADVSDGYSSTDNADYAKRICTSITVCDSRNVSVREDCTKRFISSTETRSISHSTIHGTNHHRKIDWVCRVEEDVVTCKHHKHIEENVACSENVKLHTTFTETLKETWTYLKSNHEDE